MARLPDDIWRIVLSFVSGKELLKNVRTVSRRWRLLSLSVLRTATLTNADSTWVTPLQTILRWLQEYCSEIKVLNAYRCSQSFDDECFKYIPETVSSLNVFWCKKITDSGLKHISIPLEEFAVGRTCIGAKGIQNLLSVSSIVTSIRTLDFDGCINVTDEVLKHLGKCDRLESLNLASCIGITDEGIMTYMHQNNGGGKEAGKCMDLFPHLKNLTLDNNRNLTDRILISTAEIKEQSDYDIYGEADEEQPNEKRDGDTWCKAGHFPPSLETLSLVRCVGLSLDIVKLLNNPKIFPNLKDLVFENVSVLYKKHGADVQVTKF